MMAGFLPPDRRGLRLVAPAMAAGFTATLAAFAGMLILAAPMIVAVDGETRWAALA